MRVFELARVLGISSKELMAQMAQLDLKVSSHMASLDEATVAKVKAALASFKEKTPTQTEEPSSPTELESASAPSPPPSEEPTTVPSVPQAADIVSSPKEDALELKKEVSPSSSVSLEPEKPKLLSVKVPITVKELAEKLSVSPSELIKHLLNMKILATINQLLTEEPVDRLLKLYGYQYQPLPSLEEQLQAMWQEQDDPSQKVPRPPIVTFMGHVDHGKTSLLDAIRQTRIVEGEAGGITQHIGAYRVSLPKGTITFLDTPGHEAFTAMRARGANVTDIVVLVVAADDGVMPQTIEAIHHAKAAGATIVVAINKIDKPEARVDRVKQQLMEHGLVSEEWGGKTVMVPVSAKTGEGIDTLLDMILLEAELLELKANPHRPARGVVLEGKLSKAGTIGHLLVQEGTLRVGDAVVTGEVWGKVRALLDVRGHRLKEAGPSAPVEVLGLSGVPKAGDRFMVVPEERQAREIALTYKERQREAKPVARRVLTLEEFRNRLEAGQVKSLNLILKADVHGSVEALRDAIAKVVSDRVKLNILHWGVGSISESDILLAEASDAVVMGFNVSLTQEAQELARREAVDVRLYRVIYEAVEDVRSAIAGLLGPKQVEQVLGRAKVLQVFQVSKAGKVAGCQVVKGKLLRNSLGRVWRGQTKIFEGKIISLKRFKDDVREVPEGVQCGLALAGFDDYQPNDFIESIAVQEVAQTL